MNILADKLVFPESPRWHRDRLWFSDMHDQWVKTVTLSGQIENIVKIEHKPSGLVCLDNNIFVASMNDRQVYRLNQDEKKLHPYADLSSLEPIAINDMHISENGDIYVGGFGFNLSEPIQNTVLTKLKGHTPTVVAKELCFPNGITSKDKYLYVAETFANKITRYDILENGELHNPIPLIEDLPLPDGICIDKENKLWVSSVGDKCVYGFDLIKNDRITINMATGYIPFAVEVAHLDKKTLFITQAETYDPGEAIAKKSGIIEMITLD